MNGDVARTLAAVWRIESARLVAAVARLVRDVALAEELAHDAMVAALERWPRDGLPDNPAAWLMTAARNRALDRLRQDALHRRKQQELGADADARGDHVVPDFSDALDAADEIDDDLLRLVFCACHPLLGREAQVALTLKLVAGLTTAEIARAYLLPEATLAQRIVRAKRTLSAARVPFEVPRGGALVPRLAAVLEVVYLIFNEGYSASAGDDLMRPALCDEALRLGRMLAALMPRDAEVLGLMALMEIQASRANARVDAQGVPVLLPDQDRSRWDRLLIGRGLAALAAIEAAQPLREQAGPYELQARIAACHAQAAGAAATDWPRIVALYDELGRCRPSPVVELNRAVAVGMAWGAARALPLVDALAADPALTRYPWLGAVRGDLLARLGRADEARREFERAAALTGNRRERRQLLARARGERPETGMDTRRSGGDVQARDAKPA
ncbi:MAG: sigma-70 family RNA polymerase sigma factor [Burkholderiales bacterium]|nr:sigma-70 family RNA polymerase sigma factor [Burkholderiales bacterium]MDE1925995.1 sigma-70 family RNA polymerase sigma factor [Burkholderiales bacterium]MDE2157941.1 sigma-70 family RNA polymerase sigma factor [Burkholderiales bacterium]